MYRCSRSRVDSALQHRNLSRLRGLQLCPRLAVIVGGPGCSASGSGAVPAVVSGVSRVI